MTIQFTNPIQFYVTKTGMPLASPQKDFHKILDYLLTFVGDIEVKKSDENNATIIYPNTPLKATLFTEAKNANVDSIVSNQITLICEGEDNITVNLIKNVTSNLGLRIFNPQNQSYLLNDQIILDLTTIKLEPQLEIVFKKRKLKPLYQYRDSFIFFVQNQKGEIHLVNRHILEYAVNSKYGSNLVSKNDFSVCVAHDIGHFVALFDRGLIPISFYQYKSSTKKVINLSGFDIYKSEQSLDLNLIYFIYDHESQSFSQFESPNLVQKLTINKGGSIYNELQKILTDSPIKNSLAIKIAQDITYTVSGNDLLVPLINTMVFLDN